MYNSIKSSIDTQLDYTGVDHYWKNAKPSILGPYMMDGFGFPIGAGQFRFQAECKIVKRLIQRFNNHCMLDLGCGVGYWTEYFARQFTKVIAVEASPSLFESMMQRCAKYPNVHPLQGDVLSFKPEESYSMIFFGGMLMYLNESDVIALLRKLIPFIEKGGAILCRESTVHKGTMVRNGTYQAIYRSVKTYTDIFEKCGLSVVQIEKNLPYNLLQMGCESIRKWKKIVPKPLQVLPVVGQLSYFGLRLCNPWITGIPAVFNYTFPELTNHFFLLRPAN
ncbi:class I SAM-dependent methyltransferase [Bacteroidales bacterium AH-315-I05]|nr:class I SAM-dependent methyltransferase [Bacteroidales bacterium AH-315-I05]